MEKATQHDNDDDNDNQKKTNERRRKNHLPSILEMKTFDFF